MKKQIIILVLFTVTFINAQSIYEPVDLSKVKFEMSDLGKMWTFDSVPVDQFEKLYGFKPSKEWLDDVRMSALLFGGGCTAAFISADGLIMTNHHCGRQVLPGVSPAGKDYLRDGYFAEKIADEIPIKGLSVDQLVMIEDVTKEVVAAMNSGKDDNEKIKFRNDKITEIQKRYNEKTGLSCRVVKLYNGGKFSLYGYKRYTDLRLVFAPDFQIASTGWDWDNFTYPRFELDFMFFRAYENGKPIKAEHFFKWSKEGAKEGEPVFVVGNPGSTQRLLSVAHLEFLRDKTYKYSLLTYNEAYKVNYELFQAHPEKRTELLNGVMGVGNGRKSYAGRYMGLRDELIMKKKREFENELIKKVNGNPELKNTYGHVWDAIKSALAEYRKIIDDATAYSVSGMASPVYLNIANEVIKFAEELKNTNTIADEQKIKDFLDKAIFKNIDGERQKKLTRAFANVITGILGEENPLVKKLFGGKKGDEAADYLYSISKLLTKESVADILKKSPDEILNCGDLFIYFKKTAIEKLKELAPKAAEIGNTLQVLNQLLGEVAYKIFGDKMPPDATMTLRISDGRLEGYEYNGTVAPAKTTFLGLYDKWYSFGQKDYPFGLHPRWQSIPAGFNLSTFVGFASTNDIVGGNSGSSVININKEVIGVAHDGNLESLAGDFIFLPEVNRTVSSDSQGMIEALRYYFKADRIVKELRAGKITE
ncbi:MAG: peptidase S46 [Flavobacterium sp.]|nr:peptidase S46 [Flavobacterium sp.]